MEDLEARRKAERDILRAMCQGLADGALRAEAAKILADYRFADPTHQIIFDALHEMRTADPQLIREQLPARLNNKGFPDLDLETFFQPQALTPSQILARLHILRGSPHTSSR